MKPPHRRQFLHLAAGCCCFPSRLARREGANLSDKAGAHRCRLAGRRRDRLSQPVIIENVAGATGSIGVGRVVRAAGDGYTLSIGTLSTHVLSGALYALPYDVLKDLTPVAQLASEPLLIVTKKTMPANDLNELIAWLKANPDKASQGTAGVGNTSHVAGLLFQKETGTRFQVVPYRGSAPAMQDLIAGQIDIMIDAASNTVAQILAGSIKAYAVAGKTRLAAAPEIPTVDEAWIARVLLLRLVRSVGACTHAEGHRRQAQCRSRGCPGGPDGARADRRSRAGYSAA
jgi:tripartite-type tricarboxylate transporter receptor subunit TctC